MPDYKTQSNPGLAPNQKENPEHRPLYPQRAEIDLSMQIGDASTSLQSLSFQPFEKEIQCPSCEHHMLMWLQPLHNDMDIACPACLQPLGYVIRREIRLHQQT